MPAPSAWGRSVGQSAAQRIATAQLRLLELRKTREQQATAAREGIRTRLIDGVLCLDDGHDTITSPADVSRRRDLAAKQVREKYDQQIADLHQEITEDQANLDQVAGETRPRLGDDAATQQRAVNAWEHSIKPRLVAGMRPSQILATADQVTALALAEWGPSWLQAQHQKGRRDGVSGLTDAMSGPLDTAFLTNAVDARLAELDQDFATYRTAKLEADKVAAAQEPLASYDSGAFAGNALAAAVDSHYAAQDVDIANDVTAADASTDGAAEAS